MTGRAPDRALVDDWHVVVDRSWLKFGQLYRTKLFGAALQISLDVDGRARVSLSATGAVLPSVERYGLVFASVGRPARDVVDIPEARESDRLVVTGGSIGVGVSGLRAVENFLDLGHLPFVHTDILGDEAHTEVENYDVARAEDGGILVTNCRFFQPVASPSASGGIMADYAYRVFRPFTVGLYKTNPKQPDRRDFIALFVQPVDEERCVAHSLLAYVEDGLTAAGVRAFMQLIFAQDKPILENHVPKRLPLDPRAETPIRADKSSIAYRRWLSELGVTYGAIPA
ncbi:aromatic ring-hydroxylating dioxygenase subunit alpha [Methylopila henanensis]|uniref:Aromatic ring-hydroxylating dioxygenase subunit alpha n=1 Tax=Methylopila henanensis TaxID=873516 RepID=A0ABW4KAJ1_9HYPH